MEGTSAPAIRRDPYEVLSVSKESSDQEIKTAYRKLALKSVTFLLFTFYLIFSLFAHLIASLCTIQCFIFSISSAK